MQLDERIRSETLLADLSARFVGLPAEALDREIEEAQRRIGKPYLSETACEWAVFEDNDCALRMRVGLQYTKSVYKT